MENEIMQKIMDELIETEAQIVNLGRFYTEGTSEYIKSKDYLMGYKQGLIFARALIPKEIDPFVDLSEEKKIKDYAKKVFHEENTNNMMVGGKHDRIRENQSS